MLVVVSFSLFIFGSVGMCDDEFILGNWFGWFVVVVLVVYSVFC